MNNHTLSIIKLSIYSLLFLLFTVPIVGANYSRGVKIIFNTSDTMFPRYWRGGRIRGYAQPLERRKRDDALRIIKKELKKYPRALLRNNLKKIYILRKLSFFGLSYGGTYHTRTKTVYIIRGYTTLYFKQLFHKEFSSILFKRYRYKFPKQRWKAVNPSSFRYRKGGIHSLKTGTSSLSFSEHYFKMGFLYQYATSSIEEDFNSFAGNIFTNKKRFWRALSNYPRLQKKFILIANFYKSINPFYSPKHFKKMAGLKHNNPDEDNQEREPG